eukprot:gene1554-1693_t
MSLEEQLAKKTAELETLQRSFDEYVESSKELENEMDKSLSIAERELKEKDQKIQFSESKIKELVEEYTRLKKVNGNLQEQSLSAKAKLASLEDSKRNLEVKTEDLSNQVRILKASEEDLQHKLLEAEEDIIFLNNDIEDLKANHVKSEERIHELERQLESMQSEQGHNEAKEAHNSYSAAMLADAETTIQSLQSKIKELIATNEELRSSTTLNTELEKEIVQLQEVIRLKENELFAKEKEIDMYKEQRTNTSTPDKPGSEIDLINCGDIKREIESEEDTLISPKAASDEHFDFNEIASQQLTFTSPDNTMSGGLKLDTLPSVMLNMQPILESSDLNLVRQELRKITEKYENIRNSNTRLINKMQAIRGNILVGCRTRPASDQELLAGGKICVDAYDDVELLLYDNLGMAWKSFAFDRVWPADANQVDIFADIEPLVLSTLDGYNACVMAYGQTGSGKTHTMEGTGDQYGVNYRTIQTMFDVLQYRKSQAVAQYRKRKEASVVNGHVKASSSASNLTGAASVKPSIGTDPHSSEPLYTVDEDNIFKYKIEISMLEIYNEQVYDLLHDSAGGGQSNGASLDIRLSPDNGISVPGLKAVTVFNMEEVQQVFAKGAKNRATATTHLNEHSSRSHLIIQVDVSVESVDQTSSTSLDAFFAPNGDTTASDGSSSPTKFYSAPVTGRMYLVDLAGSERITKSGAVGSTLKEALYINKSLLALGDVMEALDQKQKHIPYRNSKLTFLLQNALGGSARTMMIVTVCPTSLTYEESLFTLQFATRVRNISLGPIQKTHLHSKNLELIVKSLKSELKDVKKKKIALEETVADMKREQKKLLEKSSSVMENKLKASEEGKRIADIQAQNLSKQIADLTAKYTEEKATREHMSGELDLCQRNLRKALEQIVEHSVEIERLQTVIRGKDREIESTRAALIRVYNSNLSPGVNGTKSPRASLGSEEGPPEHRLSFSGRVAFKLEGAEGTGGDHAVSHSPKPSVDAHEAVKHQSSDRKSTARATHTGDLTAAMPPPAPVLSTDNNHSSQSNNGSRNFLQPTTQVHSLPTPPSNRSSLPSNSGTRSNSNSRSTRSSVGSATKANQNTAPPSVSSSISTPLAAKNTRPAATPVQQKSSLLLDSRSNSATRMRNGATGGTPSSSIATPSPNTVKQRPASLAGNNTLPAHSNKSSLNGNSDNSSHASVSSGTSLTAKIPLLSARSEEALRRHQLRMEKRREAMAALANR